MMDGWNEPDCQLSFSWSGREVESFSLAMGEVFGVSLSCYFLTSFTICRAFGYLFSAQNGFKVV